MPTPGDGPADDGRGERKHVTILAVAREGLPADAAVRQRLGAAITAHGGRLPRLDAGGLLGVFGIPSAREDDPERALRAALELQHAASVPIGIHTGLATLTGAARKTPSVSGEAVELAQRLAAAAAGPGIVISQATYRQVQGLVRVREAASVPHAYVVESMLPPAPGGRGVEGVDTKTIGRGPELAGLKDALRRTVAGAGPRILTVIGDAGVGKSRLLEEFRRSLDASGEIRVFHGRGLPQWSAVPYGLLRSVIASAFEIRESDAASAVRDKLEDGVASFVSEGGAAKAHALGAWLGFDFADSPHLAGVRADPRQLDDRALLVLGELLSGAAGAGCLAILLDDIHWADDPSLEALEAVIARQPELSVLVVGVSRPTLLERRPWGTGQSFHGRLEIHPLPPGDARLLVLEILKQAADPPAALVDLVAQRCEGNPFYAEELVKMLIDDGVIDTSDQPWRVHEPRLAGLRVPSTLTGVLQARLDSLQPGEKAALQKASVIGRVFWHSAVAFLGGHDGAALGRDLGALRARELVFERPQSAFEGTTEHVFKHALLRDVVYATLVEGDRRAYHAAAAGWLVEAAEGARRGDEYAGPVAEHYVQAGDSASAARWFQRAGLQASRQNAHAEAVRCATRGLELLPASSERARFELLLLRERAQDLRGARSDQLDDLVALESLAEGSRDDRQRIAVALRHAAFSEVTGDYPGAIAHARNAVGLSIAGRDATNEAAAVLIWGRVLWRQAAHVDARIHLERALGLARTSQLPRVEAEALRVLGLVAWHQSDHASARGCHEESLRLYRRLGDRLGEGAALNNLGFVAFSLGDYTEARARGQEALAVCREIGNRHGEAVDLGFIGLLDYLTRDYAAALARQKETLELALAIGARREEGYCHTNMGNALLALGDAAPALECFRRGYALRRETGEMSLAMESLAGMARAASALGRESEARQAVDEVLAFLESRTLDGADDAAAVYLTVFRVLDAVRDPRARAVLDRARVLLQEQAGRISDPELRRSFLDNVPSNRELLRLAAGTP